jgi:hypothetical protein
MTQMTQKRVWAVGVLRLIRETECTAPLWLLAVLLLIREFGRIVSAGLPPVREPDGIGRPCLPPGLPWIDESGRNGATLAHRVFCRLAGC